MWPERKFYVEEARKQAVLGINVMGYDFASSLRAVELAGEFPEVFAGIGIHPHDALQCTSENLQTFRELLANKDSNRIVAIGEIGLDYHFEASLEAEIQKSAFIKQMELAYTYDLPVSIHSRDAGEDTLTVLNELKDRGHLRNKPGVIHCFDYDLEMAKEFLDLGFLLGVDGPVTFKNGQDKREIVKQLDLDKILLETDSPYMAPEPYRGKLNQPAFLPEIAQKIATIKQVELEQVISITSRNAFELFELGRISDFELD